MEFTCLFGVHSALAEVLITIVIIGIVAKFCPSDNSVTGCFPDEMYKRLNGSDWDKLNKRTFLRVLLADGSAICFFLESNYSARKTRNMSFDVDANGRRKPNILGRDSYAFNFYPQSDADRKFSA